MANEFQGLFTSPEEIRLGRIQALQQQAAQQRMMGGSMSGLLGQVAAGTGGAIAEGLAGMFGLKTAQEKQAEQTQQLLNTIDTTDPQSLASGIEAAKAANLPKVVTYLQGKATEVAATTRARQVEDREYALKYMAEMRAQNKSDAEIRKILAEASKLEKTTPLEVRIRQVEASIAEQTEGSVVGQAAAEAQSAIAQAQVDAATVGTRIAGLKADVAKTVAETGLAGAKTQQTSLAIDQAIEKFPAEMNLLVAKGDQTRAATALALAQATSETTLLPHKVKKIAAESQLMGYQQESIQALTEQRRAQILNMGQTDFLRELDRSNISDEEKEALIRQRLEGQSITAGVQGYTPDSAITEARTDKAIKIAASGIDAQRSLDRSNNILVALDRAATGKFASEEAFIKSWMGQMGFKDAQLDTVSNELFKVLRGEITLDAAGNLKGALSDKDLAFLQDTIPAKDMSVMGLRTIFGGMAAEHAGEVYSSNQMDKFLNTTSANELRAAPIDSINAAYQAQGRAMYLFGLKQQGRLPEDYKVPVPTEAQRQLIKKYGG